MKTLAAILITVGLLASSVSAYPAKTGLVTNLVVNDQGQGWANRQTITFKVDDHPLVISLREGLVSPVANQMLSVLLFAVANQKEVIAVYSDAGTWEDTGRYRVRLVKIVD